MAQPKATLVVPAYNVAATISKTLDSLLAQTFADFELIVVDDGSSDNTLNVVACFDDPRIRVITQTNRGLAGAHNTGIHASRAPYIGFCDADDLWAPEKLAAHVAHLDANPGVGVSFSGSHMIDDEGRLLSASQKPKLKGVTAFDVLMRNPIGNGSSPVMRREALDAIAWRPDGETERDWWFDETFRQSDDIEGWMRFALTTSWKIEGVPGLLTYYRVNNGGLSAHVERQYESWERMIAKMEIIAPDFIARHAPAARAYQHRYLARRAVAMRDGGVALDRMIRSIRSSMAPFRHEPVKSLTTLAASLLLAAVGPNLYACVEAGCMGMKRAVSGSCASRRQLQ